MSVRGDGRERSQEMSKRILRERVNEYHTESEVDCTIRASERKRERERGRRQRLRAGGAFSGKRGRERRE